MRRGSKLLGGQAKTITVPITPPLSLAWIPSLLWCALSARPAPKGAPFRQVRAKCLGSGRAGQAPSLSCLS